LPPILLSALLVSCAAGAPSLAARDRAALYGTLRLAPRQGVTPPSRQADAIYADPRLRDITLVDYSRPGFAVVYLDDGSSPGGSAELSLRSSVRSVRLDPERAALGAGGVLRIRNATDLAHVVSLPGSGIVRRIGPGERFETVLGAGPHEVIVLDTDAEAIVFAAPGPLARVRSDGSFELRDLAPGPALVRTWHPRFPSAERRVELGAGEAQRLDLEVGVDLIGGERHALP
jgi:hypothetical protein